MTMEKNYQLLMDNVYIGGANQVQEAHTMEGLDVIIDLRAETDMVKDNLPRIHMPIVDNAEQQEESVKAAIEYVMRAKQDGKKVYFHCSGGRNRTGTVAMGMLLHSGKASTVEEAEQLVTSIRPVINVKPELKNVLQKMYKKH
ncbi:hypothetical protein FIU87_14370 [Bacillus sp. THAF10]|uniref:protein-tyrosine phosphatase family protein n=1 Tax=Bacillus sp. THAF10 TaxID=2587848 RepID=UPI0012684F38|nr:dual specificity protein phosphatase family protein [Bacillus sp. THAF10]QFT89845.1 hypothetical protein FIU87_14370 [Bacillus sp. THAF10]